MADACCTCARLLSNITPLYDENTEKPVALDRRLECCNRIICGTCIHNNPRFDTYCIFCQISTIQTSLPQGLRSNHHSHPPPPAPPYNSPPPIYTPSTLSTDNLPPYSSLLIPSTTTLALSLSEKTHADPSNGLPVEDVLHFLNYSTDSMLSLSLRYGVPINELRRANGITSDHLLLARRTVIIPGEFYKGGVSLSPRPVEGEEEEMRKSKIRRWMVACKVADYDVALLYLKQADYDLEDAIEAYKDDERWEKEHPLEAPVKGKGKAKYDLGKPWFTRQRS